MIDRISAVPVETARQPLILVQDQKSDIVDERVLPLYSEEITVSRRKIEKAIVRVATVTHTREAVVDEQLTHQRVEVEHVAIGRAIKTIPPVREEGDVTIIPVVEEIVVVERRLILKEEVRLRKVRVTEQHLETVVLREQDALITRTETANSSVT